jgi:transposase
MLLFRLSLGGMGSPQQLFGWRREARQWAVARDRTEDGKGASGSGFAPVVVDMSEPSAAAPIAPCRTPGAAIIEIVIGAAMVRVAPGIDAVTLATVLRAVKVTAA